MLHETFSQKEKKKGKEKETEKQKGYIKKWVSEFIATDRAKLKCQFKETKQITIQVACQ